MKKIALLAALIGTVALPMAAFAETAPMVEVANTTVHTTPGTMVYAGHRRLGAAYRVLPDGSPQVILDGQLITVPAATLSLVDGKVTTNLTIAQLSR